MTSYLIVYWLRQSHATCVLAEGGSCDKLPACVLAERESCDKLPVCVLAERESCDITISYVLSAFSQLLSCSYVLIL